MIGIAISALLHLVGEKPDEPLGLAIGETFTLPLEALAVPVMYWRLRELETRTGDVSAPAPPRRDRPA